MEENIVDKLGYKYYTLYGYGIKDMHGKIKREIINAAGYMPFKLKFYSDEK